MIKKDIVHLEEITKNMMKLNKLHSCRYARFLTCEEQRLLSEDYPVVVYLSPTSGMLMKNKEADKKIKNILIDASSHRIKNIQIRTFY